MLTFILGKFRLVATFAIRWWCECTDTAREAECALLAAIPKRYAASVSTVTVRDAMSRRSVASMNRAMALVASVCKSGSRREALLLSSSPLPAALVGTASFGSASTKRARRDPRCRLSLARSCATAVARDAAHNSGSGHEENNASKES